MQLVKSTALASIVGYQELTKTAQILTNATFQPFLIYGIVALIYFALCYPLTVWSRKLERQLAVSASVSPHQLRHPSDFRMTSARDRCSSVAR